MRCCQDDDGEGRHRTGAGNRFHQQHVSKCLAPIPTAERRGMTRVASGCCWPLWRESIGRGVLSMKQPGKWCMPSRLHEGAVVLAVLNFWQEARMDSPMVCANTQCAPRACVLTSKVDTTMGGTWSRACSCTFVFADGGLLALCCAGSKAATYGDRCLAHYRLARGYFFPGGKRSHRRRRC